MWYVYILECNDATLYTGVTTDITRRLVEHNTSTKGAKYTRSRRPVKIVYSCSLPTRSEAQKQEYLLRKKSKEEKTRIIMTRNGSD